MLDFMLNLTLILLCLSMICALVLAGIAGIAGIAGVKLILGK